MMTDLWNAPGEAIGCSIIGSSEASMLGGMAAKWRWRKRRQQAGLPTDKPNMVCGSVQICWKKFARYWDIEMRELEMRPGELCITPERVLEAVDENTIFVVPTMGVTYHGLYEDVQAISHALDDYQARTGIDFRFTSMVPVVAFLPPSAPLTCRPGISGLSASSRSMHQAISSVLPLWVWAG